MGLAEDSNLFDVINPYELKEQNNSFDPGNIASGVASGAAQTGAGVIDAFVDGGTLVAAKLLGRNKKDFVKLLNKKGFLFGQEDYDKEGNYIAFDDIKNAKDMDAFYGYDRGMVDRLHGDVKGKIQQGEYLDAAKTAFSRPRALLELAGNSLPESALYANPATLTAQIGSYNNRNIDEREKLLPEGQELGIGDYATSLGAAGLEGLVGKLAIDRILKPTGSPLKNIAMTVPVEGLEESVQTLAQQVGEGKDIDGAEIATAGLMGAASGPVMGVGGQTVSRTALAYERNKHQKMTLTPEYKEGSQIALDMHEQNGMNDEMFKDTLEILMSHDKAKSRGFADTAIALKTGKLKPKETQPDTTIAEEEKVDNIAIEEPLNDTAVDEFSLDDATKLEELKAKAEGEGLSSNEASELVQLTKKRDSYLDEEPITETEGKSDVSEQAMDNEIEIPITQDIPTELGDPSNDLATAFKGAKRVKPIKEPDEIKPEGRTHNTEEDIAKSYGFKDFTLLRNSDGDVAKDKKGMATLTTTEENYKEVLNKHGGRIGEKNALRNPENITYNDDGTVTIKLPVNQRYNGRLISDLQAGQMNKKASNDPGFMKRVTGLNEVRNFLQSRKEEGDKISLVSSPNPKKNAIIKIGDEQYNVFSLLEKVYGKGKGGDYFRALQGISRNNQNIDEILAGEDLNAPTWIDETIADHNNAIVEMKKNREFFKDKDEDAVYKEFVERNEDAIKQALGVNPDHKLQWHKGRLSGYQYKQQKSKGNKEVDVDVRTFEAVANMVNSDKDWRTVIRESIEGSTTASRPSPKPRPVSKPKKPSEAKQDTQNKPNGFDVLNQHKKEHSSTDEITSTLKKVRNFKSNRVAKSVASFINGVYKQTYKGVSSLVSPMYSVDDDGNIGEVDGYTQRPDKSKRQENKMAKAYVQKKDGAKNPIVILGNTTNPTEIIVAENEVDAAAYAAKEGLDANDVMIIGSGQNLNSITNNSPIAKQIKALSKKHNAQVTKIMDNDENVEDNSFDADMTERSDYGKDFEERANAVDKIESILEKLFEKQSNAKIDNDSLIQQREMYEELIREVVESNPGMANALDIAFTKASQTTGETSTKTGDMKVSVGNSKDALAAAHRVIIHETMHNEQVKQQVIKHPKFSELESMVKDIERNGSDELLPNTMAIIDRAYTDNDITQFNSQAATLELMAEIATNPAVIKELSDVEIDSRGKIVKIAEGRQKSTSFKSKGKSIFAMAIRKILSIFRDIDIKHGSISDRFIHGYNAILEDSTRSVDIDHSTDTLYYPKTLSQVYDVADEVFVSSAGRVYTFIGSQRVTKNSKISDLVDKLRKAAVELDDSLTGGAVSEFFDSLGSKPGSAKDKLQEQLNFYIRKSKFRTEMLKAVKKVAHEIFKDSSPDVRQKAHAILRADLQALSNSDIDFILNNISNETKLKELNQKYSDEIKAFLNKLPKDMKASISKDLRSMRKASETGVMDSDYKGNPRAILETYLERGPELDPYIRLIDNYISVNTALKMRKDIEAVVKDIGIDSTKAVIDMHRAMLDNVDKSSPIYHKGVPTYSTFNDYEFNTYDEDTWTSLPKDIKKTWSIIKTEDGYVSVYRRKYNLKVTDSALIKEPIIDIGHRVNVSDADLKIINASGNYANYIRVKYGENVSPIFDEKAKIIGLRRTLPNKDIEEIGSHDIVDTLVQTRDTYTRRSLAVMANKRFMAKYNVNTSKVLNQKEIDSIVKRVLNGDEDVDILLLNDEQLGDEVIEKLKKSEVFSSSYKILSRKERAMLPHDLRNAKYINRNLQKELIGTRLDLFGSEGKGSKAYMMRKMLVHISAATDIFKRAVTVLNPKSLLNNALFNAFYMRSKGVSFLFQVRHMPKAVKDINSYRRLLAEVAKAHATGKPTTALHRKLVSHPMYEYHKMGFVQDVSHDVRLDEDVSNNPIMKLIAEKAPFKDKFGKHSKRAIANMIGADNSTTFAIGSTVMKTTDYATRIVVYKAMLGKGKSKEEAMNIALQSTADYREFNPLVVEYASRYGIVPFAIWQSKMIKPIVGLVKENPVSTLSSYILASTFAGDMGSDFLQTSVSPVPALLDFPSTLLDGGIYTQDIEDFLPAYWKYVY